MAAANDEGCGGCLLTLFTNFLGLGVIFGLGVAGRAFCRWLWPAQWLHWPDWLKVVASIGIPTLLLGVVGCVGFVLVERKRASRRPAPKGDIPASVRPSASSAGAREAMLARLRAKYAGLAPAAVSALPGKRPDAPVVVSAVKGFPVSGAHSAFVELPRPMDGDSLDRMETLIAQAIENLDGNAHLLDILSSPPWSWNPAGIVAKPSARQARILVMTRIGRLLAQRGRRLSEGQYRMRFSLAGTEWDRDFGNPTSVLRVEVDPQGGSDRVENRKWLAGVAVGKVDAGRFLVWEWGE